MNEPFRNYRVGDRVRVTPRDGGEPYEAYVFGSVGALVVGRNEDLNGHHVAYERVEMIEPNPNYPLAAR